MSEREPKWLGKPKDKGVFGLCWIAWKHNDREFIELARADVVFSEFCMLGSDGKMETISFARVDNFAFAETFWPMFPR